MRIVSIVLEVQLLSTPLGNTGAYNGFSGLSPSVDGAMFATEHAMEDWQPRPV